MFKFRPAQIGLLLAALACTAAPARAADSVRAEVGKPLLEAQKLAVAGKYRAALDKLREADHVAGKNPLETYQVERVRASAGAGAGDHEAATRAFEYLLGSGRLSAAETPKFVEGLAGMYYRARDWPKAISWINRALKDADSAPMRELLVQAYYLGGNYAAAGKALRSQTGARGASEAQLQMLANIALKQNDQAGYLNTLEQLAGAYPKPSYWADLLYRVAARPGFSERLALDLARLKLAHGLLDKPAEFVEAAQLALLAGNPAEAGQIVAQGYRAGALGNGADAARHQRLKDLAARTLREQQRAADASAAELLRNKDGDGLAALGFALVSQGAPGKGLALMQQALQLPGIRHPDQARLHLGLAYAGGGRPAEALTAFQAVRGADGSAELARYWMASPKRAP